MTTCARLEEALLEGARLGPEFEAHRASCPRCRAVWAEQQALRTLEGRALAAGPRRAPARVLLHASAVAALLLAGGLALRHPPSDVAPPTIASQARPAAAPFPSELAPSVVGAPGATAEHAELAALLALEAQLTGDGYRDLTQGDPALRHFGALPQWLAPGATLTSAVPPTEEGVTP